MYKEVGGKANKLQYIPVRKNKSDGQDYCSYRISFLNSRMGQIKYGKTPLYYTEGKFKGIPTKQHIILIMIIFDWLIHRIKRYIITEIYIIQIVIELVIYSYFFGLYLCYVRYIRVNSQSEYEYSSLTVYILTFG